MRFSLLAGGLLLPRLLFAQVFKHYEVGTYVLTSQPQVQQTGGLYLQTGEQLVARDIAGKTTVLTPSQVRSFRVGSRKFVVTGGFQTRSGLGDQYVRQAFAEQLDSGRVVLLRYESPVGNSPTPGSGDVAYGGGATVTVYLLRHAGEMAVTPVQANWSQNNKRLPEALRPFLVARPDLTKLLEEKRLAPDKLPLLIHALNAGEPYPDQSH